MFPALGDLGVAFIDLLHVALLPAGLGAVVALLVSPLLGRPTVTRAPLVLAGSAPAPAEPAAPPVPRVRSPRDALGLVVVATACSAVAHAMAGPPHAEENLVFGVFFEVVAVAQFAWAMLAWVAPSRATWTCGLIVNAALILLWALTRTVGLPFGLLDGPEEVGAWDLASKAWESLAFFGCLQLLGLVSWSRSVEAAEREGRLILTLVAVSSGVGLILLAISGPPT